ncbi:MAG: HYR domain-containing protein [Verrucomicrobiota bacterium]
MKQTKQSHWKMALLALASVALLTPVVHGQTVTAGTGQLILGFRATANPGQTVNLEVNLGSMIKFYEATPGSEIALPALSTADLAATYGAGWNSRSDLFWGTIGTAPTAASWSSNAVTVPARTLWASAPNCAPAWVAGSSTAQATPVSKVLTLLTGAPASLNGASNTANSTASAVINNSLAGSWSIQEGAGISFNFFNPTIDNFQGTNIVVSQLYELRPGTGTGVYMGDLILRNTGMSFRKAAPTAAICRNITVQAGTNCQASVTVDDIDNGSTGLCLLLGLSANGPFPVGTTNVTLTVTDSNGSNSFCTASVTVQGAAPVLPTRAPISQCSPVVSYTVGAATGCNTPIGLPVCTPPSGSSFPNGVTTVRCTATDAASKIGSNSFTVTISGSAPTIVGASPITQCATVATFAPTATDCSGASVSVVCLPASGSTFTSGVTTVRCTATDTASRIGSNSFTVTISSAAPTIVGASPISQCSPVATFTPTATDCSGASVSVVCSPASGSTFAIGNTTVRCTATDIASRIGSNSFVVTVLSTPPTLSSCPANIATNVASASNTTVVVSFSTPTATDCASAAATVVCSPASGSAFALGSTTVRCTATDTAGRTNSCSFSVSVSGLGLGAINSAVDALTDEKMTAGRKSSLNGNLTRAQAKLTAFNLDPTKTSLLKQSCAQLKAFITKVTIYKRLGIINATDADALLASANAAKLANGCL